MGESSQPEDGHCFADDKDCQNGQQSELSDTSKTDKFVPFRFSHRKRDPYQLLKVYRRNIFYEIAPKTMLSLLF